MVERAQSFRNLERQHQLTIAVLHAAQKGKVSLEDLEGKAIDAAIRAARQELRRARNLAVMSGDVQPYPKVQQMRKPVQIAEEIILSHASGNGHHPEDLSQYTSTASATRTRTLAASLS